MRIAIVSLFVLVIAAVVIASPAKNTTPRSTCVRDCSDVYEPVCGKAKSGNKERLLGFGSLCVMDNFNCQHPNDQYEIKSNGECGGKVNVRLQ